MPVNQNLLQRIKAYAEEYYFSNGISPTVREIADELGVGKSTVQRYLQRLNDCGEIEYNGKRSIKTENTEKMDTSSVSVGVYGSVSCGQLKFAQEEITEYVQLPSSLVGSGDFFMLRADGDSMINAGIDDGDLVIVKKQNTASDGQIVVALYGDETTLKRFYKDYDNKRFVLHPENEAYDDIIVEGDLYIQGVAVKVFKNLF